MDDQIALKPLHEVLFSSFPDRWGSYMVGRSARRSHSEVPDTEGYATSNPQLGKSVQKSESCHGGSFALRAGIVPLRRVTLSQYTTEKRRKPKWETDTNPSEEAWLLARVSEPVDRPVESNLGLVTVTGKSKFKGSLVTKQE